MYILDEPRLYRELMEDNSKINYDTIKRLRAYIKFLYKDGKSPSETYNIIIEFLRNNLAGFREYLWEDRLRKLIKQVRDKKNREIIKLKTIKITNEELEWIKERNDINVESVLFILLLIAKTTNSGGEQLWVTSSLEDIFTMSHAKLPKIKGMTIKKKRGLFCNSLYENGYIDINKGSGKGFFKLNYGSMSNKGEGLELTLTNENINYIVYEYHKWRGLRVINCERCGCLVPAKNNKTKYCKNCAAIIKNEQNLALYLEKNENLGK